LTISSDLSSQSSTISVGTLQCRWEVEASGKCGQVGEDEVGWAGSQLPNIHLF
jgi:hypothetical protein